jgi:low temperature requirement protein LtrA
VPAVERVSTLELFFDLVFVFTLTQLTGVLVDDLDWRSLWHVVVMLLAIFWMYDGYAWLTNTVQADSARRRAVLLTGMAGYLVIALSVPTAFDGSGLAFGLAYLAVVLVHTFLFSRTASELSAAAMRGLSPVNLLSAAALVVGGAVGGDVQDVLWTGVAAGLWLMLLRDWGVFEIAPAHFVERHGLVVIVAIGESVVAIGIGAEGLPVDAKLVVSAVLGLLLCAGLWWAYFGSDDDADAERAMQAADDARRTQIAQVGFGYAHAVILLGVILAAVGLKKTVGHATDELKLAEALALCGGVSLFLLGDVWFRRILGVGRALWRVVAAFAVLLAVPISAEVSAGWGLAAVTALLAAGLALERPAPR